MSKSVFPKLLFFILVVTFISSECNLLYPQSPGDIRNILRDTRFSELQRFSADLRLQAEGKRFQAYTEGKKKGWTTRLIMQDGNCMELREIGRNGMPVYCLTTNLTAAKTVSTNKVWSGGSSGLTLSGSGITLREWDESGVRTTHQELTGRITQGDAGTYIALHSTHVAGTMLATGIVNTAHGMANQSLLRAFDWWDDYAEMASEAANGALLSNSSYIFISGWYNNGSSWYWYGDPAINPLEDYMFGFYSADAAIVDSITFNAPYYLPCKAAGNDRGEGPSVQPVSHYIYDGSGWVLSNAVRNLDGMPGGYDCIASGWGVSKNVLTVGAVNGIPGGYSSSSDVILASFSGTGPSDDGRIKPDVVADGVGLYSTSSAADNSYVTMSGTSMATPNTTGSLGLLQQHYHNLHGSYMRSATLKGIAIHTADEAGNFPGPDYQFGWGLLNTSKAAAVIGNNTTAVIKELNLINGSTCTLDFRSNGTEPLRATISWTDPPGTVPQASLDPVIPVLVNDLDMRIDGNTYKPWVLDPASPANAAITGDNVRDNVEQVYIASPGAGCHTLTISHKGILSGGVQGFSLILTGISIYPDFIPGTISSSQSICSNSVPLMLTGIPPAGGLPPYSYQWQISPDSTNFTNIAGATGSTFQPGPLTATTYYRQVQSAAGSCNSAMTNIIKINVSPLPFPVITGSTDLCVNSGNYSYLTEPGMSGYVWSVSGGGTIINGSGTNTVQIHWTQAGPQSVSVSYTNLNGCHPAIPTILPVNVSPLPGTAQIISGQQTLCAGTTGVSYSVPPVANAMTYIWTLPDGASIFSGQLTDSITVDFSVSAVPGNFIVYGNNLCGDGNPSPAYPVNVVPVPSSPLVTQQGDSLVSDALFGNQWYNDGGLIPGATNQNFRPPENGMYRDIVTLNGCSSAPSGWVNFVALEIESGSLVRYRIFPNPADRFIHIDLLTSLAGQVHIELVNVTGIIVHSWIIPDIPAGNSSLTLDCKEIRDGVYYLKIQAPSNLLFWKIIIQRGSGSL